MGSEIDGRDLAAVYAAPPAPCRGGPAQHPCTRPARLAAVCSSGYGGYVAATCAVHLHTEVRAYDVAGFHDGARWVQRRPTAAELLALALDERDGFAPTARTPDDPAAAAALIQDRAGRGSVLDAWQQWLQDNGWGPGI